MKAWEAGVVPGERTTESEDARAELQALVNGHVRAFCLTNGNLRFDEQADWFVQNRHQIIQRCRQPGPYVYGVYRDRIEKL